MAPLAALAASSSLAMAPPAAVATARFSGLRSLRLPSAAATAPLRPRAHLVAASAPRQSGIVRAIAAEEATFNAVKDIIAEQLACEPEKITPDAKFTDLGADSLDTVEIMMALEEKFDIQLDQEAGEKIVTVGNAADLIQDVISAAEA